MAKPDTTRYYPTDAAVDAFQIDDRNIKGAAAWLKSLSDIDDATVVDANPDLEQPAGLEITRTNGDTMYAAEGDSVLRHSDGTISTRRAADFAATYTTT